LVGKLDKRKAIKQYDVLNGRLFDWKIVLSGVGPTAGFYLRPIAVVNFYRAMLRRA